MIVTVCFIGALGGALLGIRSFKVLALVPAIVLLTSYVIVTGIVTGLGFGWIAAYALTAVAILQLTYLMASAAIEYFNMLQTKAPQRISVPPAMLEAVRLAIGQELKVSFDLPRDLPPPPRMLALVEQLH
jgi:hypothetical protein